MVLGSIRAAGVRTVVSGDRPCRYNDRDQRWTSSEGEVGQAQIALTILGMVRAAAKAEASFCNRVNPFFIN